MFMIQRTLLFAHFSYHRPYAYSTLSHRNILPNTALPYVLAPRLICKAKHHVTLTKHVVVAELLNTPTTILRTPK
jgi:hypothetical protein